MYGLIVEILTLLTATVLSMEPVSVELNGTVVDAYAYE
jgi:hypothetical protein